MSSGINMDGPKQLLTITTMEYKGEHPEIGSIHEPESRVFICNHMGDALDKIRNEWVIYTVILSVTVVPIPN